MSRRILARGALVALTSLGVAGCGIQPESSARPVGSPRPQAQVSESAPASPAAAGPVVEKLFMVNDGFLVAVTRNVTAEPTVDDLVGHLLAGPDKSERAAGVTSALAGTSIVQRVDVVDRQAVVELTDGPEGTGRTDEVLAYAQLVCTLTTRPDVQTVRFTRDGQPIAVPKGDASLSATPLTANDYATLIAPR